MKMDENQQMAREIRLYTAILMLVLAFVSMFLFPGQFKSIPMGIVIGSFTGLLGFNMIYKMSNAIGEESVDVKNRAVRSYTQRYVMYAVIFALSASVGANIVALLVGMLAHKASILLYTLKHRKEDE